MILKEIEHNLKIKEDNLNLLKDLKSQDLSLKKLNKLCIESNLQSNYSFGMFLTGVLLENIQKLYSVSDNLKLEITPGEYINTALIIKKEDTGEIMGIIDPIYKLYAIYDTFKDNTNILELEYYISTNGYKKTNVRNIKDDILELIQKDLNFYVKSFNDKRLVGSRIIAYKSYILETSSSIVELSYKDFNGYNYEHKKDLILQIFNEYIKYEEALIKACKESLKERKNILAEKGIEEYIDLQVLLEAII